MLCHCNEIQQLMPCCCGYVIKERNLRASIDSYAVYRITATLSLPGFLNYIAQCRTLYLHVIRERKNEYMYVKNVQNKCDEEECPEYCSLNTTNRTSVWQEINPAADGGGLLQGWGGIQSSAGFKQISDVNLWPHRCLYLAATGYGFRIDNVGHFTVINVNTDGPPGRTDPPSHH